MRRFVLGVAASALALAGCGSGPSPQAKPLPSSSSSSVSAHATPAFGSPAVLRFRVVAQCGGSHCISSTPGYRATTQPIAAEGSTASTPTVSVNAALTWASTPPSAWRIAFDVAKCAANGHATVPPLVNEMSTNVSMAASAVPQKFRTGSRAYIDARDSGDRPLIACDSSGQKYLLSPAVMDQSDVSSATATTSQNAPGWFVNVAFTRHGTAVMADLSSQMLVGRAYGGMDFAIVVNGRVVTAPGFNAPIYDGQAQISGNFDEDSASSLAQAIQLASSARG